MRQLFLLSVLLALLAGCSTWQEMNRDDRAVEVAIAASRLVDMGQTLRIAGEPEKWYETNSILGKHPSKGKVVGYFAGLILLEPWISQQLPERWVCLGIDFEPRKNWRRLRLGNSMGCVQNNLDIGLGIGWDF